MYDTETALDATGSPQCPPTGTPRISTSIRFELFTLAAAAPSWCGLLLPTWSFVPKSTAACSPRWREGYHSISSVVGCLAGLHV